MDKGKGGKGNIALEEIFSGTYFQKYYGSLSGTIFGQNTIEGYLKTDSFVQNNQSYTLIECCFHAAIEKSNRLRDIWFHNKSRIIHNQVQG